MQPYHVKSPPIAPTPKQDAAQVLWSAGWTATRISEALGVSERTIHRWKSARDARDLSTLEEYKQFKDDLERLAEAS